MKLRNTCGLVLLFLGAASLSLQGCVRLNFETRDDCIRLPEAPAFEQQTELKYQIKVSRFEHSAGEIEKNVEIDPDEVDGIFGHATNILRCGEGNEDAAECSEVDDVQGDFACKVTLERKGAELTIPTFTLPSQTLDNAVEAAEALSCAGDGEICSELDLHAVWNADPSEGIKVVRNVKWCEGVREGYDPVTETLGPTWVGCGQLPGRSMAVERLPWINDESLEVFLWPHEFAHTKGLHHTAKHACGLNDDPNGLMSAGLSLTNTKLNGQECFGFRGGQP